MKGETQQETKRLSGFLSQDMGNSLTNLGMRKQCIACLGKLREPVRASDMTNGVFFLL